MASFMNEESSDEEFWNVVASYIELERPGRPRVFRDRSNPMTYYSDEEFRVRCRLNKHLVLDVLARVADRLQQSTRLESLLPIHQLLITLRFISSGSFQVLFYKSGATKTGNEECRMRKI